MPLPPDPELTKLRIKADRSRRAYEASQEATRRAGWDYEQAWLAYLRHGKALGYCVACERQTVDCQCIAVGGTE